MSIETMRGAWPKTLLRLAGLLILTACGVEASESSNYADDVSDDGHRGDTPSYASANPNADAYGGYGIPQDASSSADASSGSTGSDGTDGTDGGDGSDGTDADDGTDTEREIGEADIVMVVDDRLYALSRYSGLLIVDISDPNQLVEVGRHVIEGIPFEMYLQEGVAYVMVTDTWVWAWDEETGGRWDTTSRMMALDVSNPGNIAVLADHDLPGQISDSRKIGDVLYVVSFENGWCWECGVERRTVISSFAIDDPSAFEPVDELAFVEPNAASWWRRSVSATADRLYVAGLEYDDNQWENASSTITVVDVSDPEGALVRGASVPVAGTVFSRWQMNEYDGVLRVVSQPGLWNTGSQPHVETFSITSSHVLTPLGETTLTLPEPESLRSVRFDGTRGYAVTARITDPLFIIDLSNPASPEQRGELEIPGWIYFMAPFGDRLLSIGFDQQTDSGLAVSLFNVEDMDAPTLIERIYFGAEWGWMVEDQDRIHKAFGIYPDDELIVMPFAGFSGDQYWQSSYHSGVQLIDWSDDTLIKRGVATHHGAARRALLHNDRLLVLSDERLETFDIDNRDEPVSTSILRIARIVYDAVVAGDFMVQLSGDWWTSTGHLNIVDVNAPNDSEPVGSVDLSALETDNGIDHFYYGSPWASFGTRLYQHSNAAWLLWTTGATTQLASFDIADPTEPTLLATQNWPIAYPGPHNAYYGYGYYYNHPNEIGGGDRMVQVGAALAFLEGNAYPWYPTSAALRVVDLTDPAAPILRETGMTGMETLRTSGTTVYWMNSQAIDGSEPATQAVFLERLDLSDPANPVVLPPINIPGLPAQYDTVTGQLITVDRAWDETNLVTYALTVSDVENDAAWVTSSLDIGYEIPARVFADGDYLYAQLVGNQFTSSGPELDPRSSLITVTGAETDTLTRRSTIKLDGWGAELLAANGSGPVTAERYPVKLTVWDASNPEMPTVSERHSGPGYHGRIVMDGDRVTFCLGLWGVYTVLLQP